MVQGRQDGGDLCSGCGYRMNAAGTAAGTCPNCGAIMKVGTVTIEVQGSRADEVAAVTRQLVDDAAARQEVARLRSTPWVSGMFYLTGVVVIIAALLAAGRLLSAWALPIVVAGAVLLVAVVGALQLRQEDRLSERGFVRLMGDVLRRLPELLRRKSPDAGGTSSTSGKVD